MEEIWKIIPSLPGVLASNKGNILLPACSARMPHGGIRNYKTKPTPGSILKASKTAKHKYRSVFWGKIDKNLKVHRLVCEAFHGPPPSPKSVVIHLDENALNNEAQNLKWGTQKENLNAPGFIAYCKNRLGENSPMSKHLARKVLQQA